MCETHDLPSFGSVCCQGLNPLADGPATHAPDLLWQSSYHIFTKASDSVISPLRGVGLPREIMAPRGQIEPNHYGVQFPLFGVGFSILHILPVRAWAKQSL